MNRYIIFSLLFLHVSLFSHIYEIYSISEINNYLPASSSDSTNTLVILDIDNVLGQMEKLIGSPEWFYSHIQKYIKRGLVLEDAVAHTLPLYHFIQHHSDMKPVEPDSAQTIKTIQQHATHTVAMTSRGFHLAARTAEQLDSLGINFSTTSFFGHVIYRSYECYEGIIFCNGNHKGPILLEVFKKNNYWPDTIIFINDKQKYLENIEQELISNASHIPINFIGLRYNHLDEQSVLFDTEVAEYELICLKENMAHTHITQQCVLS
jgi:hypothetical protein